MPVGLLEVVGTIDVGQFWPEGRSDADTTKVVVNVAPEAIRAILAAPGDFRAGSMIDGMIRGASASYLHAPLPGPGPMSALAEPLRVRE